MKEFTVTKANMMGEPDPKYGVTWWAEVKEQKEPVMFNIMRQDNIEPGDVLTAEEVLLKTSAKGTEYHRLKKVQLGKARTASTSSPQPAGGNELLELVKDNNRMLKLLTGEDTQDRAVTANGQDDLPPVDSYPDFGE